MSQIASTVFLTQRAERINETKKEIAELEALLAGATQTSQSTLLLKKRKEMREVDEALELMKEQYKNRIDVCEERRQRFEQKQEKMREQVTKFEKFIQENDAKRQRAEMKSKQEHKIFEQKCQELNALADNIEQLEAEQQKLENELQRRSCFREYLERVIEMGDHGYEEISDLLNRYKTLHDANTDLMKNVQIQDIEIDKLRQKLQALKIETQNQLLVSNSLFQNNQKELEERHTLVKREEEEKNIQEEAKKSVVRETSQVVQAIKNIFSRCQATMRIKPQIVNNRDNALSDLLTFNLDVIHARIIDLKEICDEYHYIDHGKNDYGNVPLTTDIRENSSSTVPTSVVPNGMNSHGGKSNALRTPVSTFNSP